MSLAQRYRIPSLLCSVALLLCEWVSQPHAELGIADDWSYILSARRLEETGHLIYNGWATATLGWLLYLGAGFIKLFGFSFTSVRMSTLLLGAVTAFLMQRTMVRSGIGERNAVLGTLAVVLSPMYMTLSVTFMTDIGGLFAMVVCGYCCARALQSATSTGAAAWVSCAAAANAICGTSRQIAWLGVLVMVPSTLWLLRASRRVLVIGGVATLAGWGFVGFCLYWFAHQPGALPERVQLGQFLHFKPLAMALRGISRALLELALLILPVTVAFLPESRRNSRRVWMALAVAGVAYVAVALRLAKVSTSPGLLEPALGDWTSPLGFYNSQFLAGREPDFLGLGVRVVLTVATLAGLFSVISFFVRLAGSGRLRVNPSASVRWAGTLSWRQLGCLLGPFSAAYLLLLMERATIAIYDRYMLAMVFVGLLCLVRAYQDFVGAALPSITVATIAIFALYSIGSTHDLFAFYRARVALAKELEGAGVAPNAFDGGWEYDGWVELQRSPYLNDPRIVNPPNYYVHLDPHREWNCDGTSAGHDPYPHMMPRYGIAFRSDACQGPGPVAPVRFHRWQGLHWVTIYAVKYGRNLQPD